MNTCGKKLTKEEAIQEINNIRSRISEIEHSREYAERDEAGDDTLWYQIEAMYEEIDYLKTTYGIEKEIAIQEIEILRNRVSEIMHSDDYEADETLYYYYEVEAMIEEINHLKTTYGIQEVDIKEDCDTDRSGLDYYHYHLEEMWPEDF